MKKFRIIILLTCGSLCVILALVGIFVPVLPTTPFLLLAAVCFARSSERFYDWLLSNRLFGEYIKNYREGRGIPFREKVIILCALWTTMSISIIVVVLAWWGQLILAGIAIGVTIHIVKIKTYKN